MAKVKAKTKKKSAAKKKPAAKKKAAGRTPTKPAARKRRVPKQGQLFKPDHPVAKKLTNLAVELDVARRERMAAGKEEKVYADKILALMKKHKLADFKLGKYELQIVHESEKVKVKIKNDDE